VQFLEGDGMKEFTLEKWIRVIAGSVVLISLFLGLFVNKWCFVLNFLVGINLINPPLPIFAWLKSC
jgi:hypothetical protein